MESLWYVQTELNMSLQLLFSTNNQKRPIYECIQVNTYEKDDSILNEEVDLDNESEDSNFEREMIAYKAMNRNCTLSNLSMIIR